MTADDRVLVDTLAAATAAGVPTGTVRRWAHEGRIERHGKDARGRTRYDLDEVTRVADTLRRVSTPR